MSNEFEIEVRKGPAATTSGKPAFDEVETRDKLRRMGASFNPDVLRMTRAHYHPFVQDLPWTGRQMVQDVAYGPDERHKLDIFPTDKPTAPVILFLHGGGFIGGDKRGDPIFYANVGRYFAAHGLLTITANYRLAPAATWPSGIEDVAAMVEWIRLHAQDYGGDSSRIVLIGQSAGAAHVAAYIFRGSDNNSIDHDIRGAAMLSGYYRAKAPMVGGPLAYFGDDETVWAERSAAAKAIARHPPILLSVAELDPAPIADQTFDFASTLNAIDGRPPRLLWFEGHNHVSTVHGLGLASDTVGRALRTFAEQVT